MTRQQVIAEKPWVVAPEAVQFLGFNGRAVEKIDPDLPAAAGNEYVSVARRIRELQHRLPMGCTPRRILDFGCGIGQAAWCLAGAFRQAEIVGFDASLTVLAQAQIMYGASRISFRPAQALTDNQAFDLCYADGSLSSLPSAERLAALQTIFGTMAPGGHLAFFEENPWNPLSIVKTRHDPAERTRMLLSSVEAGRLIARAGFTRCGATRFLLHFPQRNSAPRNHEPWLSMMPFGAQYFILAAKPNANTLDRSKRVIS
jgi:SAM-dependent methyltransferase